MNLSKIVKNYSLVDIIDIEQQKDGQFVALQSSYENISHKDVNSASAKFLKAVLINALISYQLSGTGEDWWREFGIWISSDFDNIDIFSTKHWEEFLLSSQNNKRLVNIKLKRIQKISSFLDKIDSIGQLKYYYENMDVLNQDIAYYMNQKKTSKTVVFAVKMFGYAGRFVFQEMIYYPMSIGIPVDSRLLKIYSIEKSTKQPDLLEVNNFFDQLSKDSNIPPLHLDSLLWVEIWGKYIKNNI
ncbi:N-glycosylase/DNA lyase [Candidatus Absconditicoccus praedator]|uniref:N-glycosylase/DNA lyase n=1 Tax=Candidatus Absconditicoccus praedator TaxID=2735562 RepID=UPI001E54D371|nr:N-glycosylase/DNA lyase [Candidatus Absconditicoccus praedator]UFX82893.1 N-glycosylase/DNA lyase [Candidatus Absconditicoccus praedator]